MQVAQEIYDVQKLGAAMLDKHFGKPNWRNKCEGFDIRSTSNCVLGKVFGSFRDGCDRIKLNMYSAWRYGFDFAPSIAIELGLTDQKYYDMLQQAWQDDFDNPPLGTDDD